MNRIGVSAYIRKPIEKEVIRFKLESFASLIQGHERHYKTLTPKEAINPFNTDIRHFKTTFSIPDAEGMMDFGIWILSRSQNFRESTCAKADTLVELFYELMRRNCRNGEPLEIIIEESFEEMFVTFRCEQPLILSPRITVLTHELGDECIVQAKEVHARLGMQEEFVSPPQNIPSAPDKAAIPESFRLPESEVPQPCFKTPEEPVPIKEIRVIDSDEHAILRRSFTDKTTAADYIRDIGGDVLDEILDLAGLDTEWGESLGKIQDSPSAETITDFANTTLGAYVHAINGLFEFTALAYALSALSGALRENARRIADDPAMLKKLLLFLEHLGHDLSSWRGHLFEQQDAQDIHYLDSSFFSSCMQIEGIITDKQIAAEDDDNDMEFF